MRILKAVYITVLISVLSSSIVFAEVKNKAVIDMIKGEAKVKRIRSRKWRPAKVGMALSEGQALKVERDSWLLLNLSEIGEEARVEVGENSQLIILELRSDRDRGIQKVLLDLAIGQIFVKAKKVDNKESKFEVKTPTSVMDVRGSECSVEVKAEEE